MRLLAIRHAEKKVGRIHVSSWRVFFGVWWMEIQTVQMNR
jgi:hypothetical protein